MKGARSNLLKLFLLFITFLSANVSWAFSGALSGSPVGCQVDNAQLKKISLFGKVLLNRNFLSDEKEDLKQEIEDAVEVQVKHLMGYFRTTRKNHLNVALSSYRGEVEILKNTAVQYERTLVLDDYLAAQKRSFHGDTNSHYAQKALRIGKTNSQDPAYSVEYKTELLLADCSKGDFKTLNPIYLPLDPYLSFWTEDKSLRKSRRFHVSEVTELSNCQSSELVLFGTASQNWFFWSPIEPKSDLKLQKHSCLIENNNNLYQPKIVVSKVLPAAEDLSLDFYKNLNSFKFATFFGVITHDPVFQPVDYAKFKQVILANAKKCQELKLVPRCLSAWSESYLPKNSEKTLEPGAINFFQFLRGLYGLVKIEKFELIDIRNPSGEIQLNIKGLLLDSQFPVEISVYYGTTTMDYGPKISPAYIKLWHQSLKEADAVSYIGHAGLGSNVLMARFKKLWMQEKLPLVQRTKPLWFGIYNCEGFSYFGFDQEDLFRPGTMDLILTASSGVETESRFALAQLSAIDKVMSGRKVSLRKYLGNYVRTRNFYTEMRLTN